MAALDIPNQSPFLQATFQQTHVLMRVEPNDDPALAYELLVPKTWGYSRQFGPVTTSLLSDRGIGFFTGSVEPGAPVIAAVVTEVPYEIPIDAWARASFAHEGWEIVAGSWFPGPNGLYFDLTGTRVVEDVQQVRRTALRVRGSSIFSLNCITAREHWDAVKELFWLALSSFKLAQPGPTRMESWLQAKIERAPSFELAHPATWVSEPVDATPANVSALDIRLVDADAEKLLGYLQVKAVRRDEAEPVPTLEALQATAMANLQGSGFATEEELVALSEADDPRSIAVQGWRAGYRVNGTIAGGDISVRLGFVERDSVSVTFLMMSPRLENNPLIALRAQRVFEIARASLKLL